MTDFDELTYAIQQFIEERDWKQFHKSKDCAISLSLEAAEVAELFQWKNDELQRPLLDPRPRARLRDEAREQ